MKIKLISIILLFGLSITLTVINPKDNTNRYRLWQPDLEINSSFFLKFEPLYNFRYDAAIAPMIVLKRAGDSIYAVTIIDTYNSWIRSNHSTSKNLLKHEMYHANITEIFTRELNKILAERPNLTIENIYNLRNLMVEKGNHLHGEYDKNTNHGIISDQQLYWEYKIDSMLYNNPRIVDYFSGVSACFPTVPKSQNYFFIDDSQASKYFELIKYGVEFKAMIDYDYKTDSITFINLILSNLSEKTTYLKTSVSSENAQIYVDCEYIDTSKMQKQFDKFIIGENHLFYFSFSINQNLSDKQEFLSMKDNYLNSIKFDQYNNYWIEEYNKVEKPKTFDVTAKGKYDKDNLVNIRYYSKSDRRIAYHLPIFNKDHYIIPFEPIVHKIDEIDEILYMINNDYTLMQYPMSQEQFIRIDMDDLRRGSNEIIFGYTLKSEKEQEEKNFYQARAYIFVD